MTVPNLITILRLLLVPVILYGLIKNFWWFAFVTFLIASLSDAVDGFIARHFDQKSELGKYLDPIADKAFLSSVFIILGSMGALPLWLVLIVVSRDILIVVAVLLSAVMENPVKVKPLMISKITTLIQIILAFFTLGEKVFESNFSFINFLLIYATAFVTLSSAFTYIFVWMNHMTGKNYSNLESE